MNLVRETIETIGFERGKDPKGALDLGMTTKRNKEYILKWLKSKGIQAHHGWDGTSGGNDGFLNDGFWLRFSRNIFHETNSYDFILWHLGKKYKFADIHSEHYPEKLGWSLWDPLSKKFVFDGAKLEEIQSYIKDTLATEYKLYIGRMKGEMQLAERLLKKINVNDS